MPAEIRPIDPSEWPTLARVAAESFLGATRGDRLDRVVERITATEDPARTRCAFEDGTMVGTLSSHAFELTVPGGVLAAAGTAGITVLPSHRRRGLMRAMLEAHLDDARRRGEAVAVLIASDSAIYPRFGYGLASVMATTRVDTRHAQLHPRVSVGDEVAAVDPTDIPELAADVFDRIRLTRPGMFARSPEWWMARSTSRDRHHPEQRAAVARREGAVTGWVEYEVSQPTWTDHHSDAGLKVQEIIGVDGRAHTGLWKYLFAHDLVQQIDARFLAIDDPIFSMLAGWRRAVPTIEDQLFLRIIDVPAALAGRRYALDGRLTLALRDPAGGPTRRYRLEVEDGRARCEPTDGAEDAVLDLADLSSAYLGRSRLAELARVGRVDGDPATLHRVDRMFSWDPPPWCQEPF